MHIDTIFYLIHQFVTILHRFCQTVIIFNISTFIESDAPVSTASTNLRKIQELEWYDLYPSDLVTDMLKFAAYVFYLFRDVIRIPKLIVDN